MNELAQVGPRLRAARQARGWTLDDLASRASISASTLSRLESGKRQATLELVVPLTRQLGIRVDDLLPPADRDPRVRRPEMRRDGMVMVPLAPESSSMRAYRITYTPQHRGGELRVHDGHEWLYVLSGRLRLLLGDQDLVLEPGEAAEFDTRMPHSMTSADGAEVTVLSLFSEAGERIHTWGAGVPPDPEGTSVREVREPVQDIGPS
ncbi:helix-turn-helix domain-containing protein [Demequina activiva]|uniref:XRE family transcriptional regulator n=1 Tax=Demequina activiva TaxID=1582364 RepID=A0A919Q2D3_9MICO|nr:XRE family transcriptional regulator [Demequina activiva]GIG54769.1 XRE family transcriptional regulator [Demequina activiva]